MCSVRREYGNDHQHMAKSSEHSATVANLPRFVKNRNVPAIPPLGPGTALYIVQASCPVVVGLLA